MSTLAAAAPVHRASRGSCRCARVLAPLRLAFYVFRRQGSTERAIEVSLVAAFGGCLELSRCWSHVEPDVLLVVDVRVVCNYKGFFPRAADAALYARARKNTTATKCEGTAKEAH